GLGLRRSILPSVQLGSLYGMDTAQNTLVLFDTDQTTLRTVGPLSLFLTGNVVGFDIQTGAQVGYAAASPLCFEGCPTPSTLVGVDLTFGRATPVGGIGGGEQVRALAVVPKHSFSFARSAVEHVSEGNFALTLTVLRTDDASTPATVNYSTGEETNAPGAASPRSDFNAAYGTLRFAPGENVKTVQILLNEDSHVEQAAVGPNGRRGETFSVSLHDPSPGYFVGPEPEATVFIEDDNPEQTTNPIDDSENFVRQHYHDFFNREGDAPGIAFWTQNIESCGANNGCRTFKRAETSAAFFLSIEFQETGYLVYRFHETAYNRGPSLTFFDFLRDTSRVSEGVVVGQGDWQARLAANKQAYADEFVRSSLFVNLYGGMSNALYVDVLDQNAGGVLSATERAALIAGLNSNAITRAQALLAVAEDEDLKRNEKSRAFVYMQYIGYLRREPERQVNADERGGRRAAFEAERRGGGVAGLRARLDVEADDVARKEKRERADRA
ncbi:MAG TPA: DUF4394 domain-containing protein, partial [Pyrinomonadaceae bacterium]|nr:DUF4394 domain-containing protein [Pyrinomonadaceae bacterium]